MSEANRKRRMTVDQKSYDLAEHFLADHKSVTKQEAQGLAEAIQSAVEDYLTDFRNKIECEGCPPIGYPTDETRCTPCPRRKERRMNEDDYYNNNGHAEREILDALSDARRRPASPAQGEQVQNLHELIERLEARCAELEAQCGDDEMRGRGSFWVSEFREISSEIGESADALRTLIAERDSLREALRPFAALMERDWLEPIEEAIARAKRGGSMSCLQAIDFSDVRRARSITEG